MAKEKTRPVTGYYRYTDIRFEWFKAIPENCKEELQSFLFPTCLTNPEHPLCVGKGGLELQLATIKSSGETRLLFSSAQIEYTQYWLYEMGLTPTKIPLPRSQYLITEDKIRTMSTTIYTSDAQLKKAQKDLTKANKRLKGVDMDMQQMRDIFERTRQYYQNKGLKASWCSIDIEDWEYMHDDITEFGYSIVQWEGEEEKRERGHWVVRGAARNGKFVPDNRDRYLFGKSEEVTKKELPDKIKTLIDGLAKRGPLFLVFHDWSNDTKQLQAIGSLPKGVQYSVPDSPPSDGIICVDTRKLFGALEGHKEPKSLTRICRILGFQDLKYFHNAGNDAEYTMMCLVSMASGLPIDAQREQRWPTKPSDIIPNVKREYAREPRPEDESDYEDPYKW